MNLVANESKRTLLNGAIGLLVLLLSLACLTPPAEAADSPMLHNSNRFPATTKHGGSWGLPGTKYGEFTCGTCHDKNTGNIKRVKKILTAPNGVDQFPIEADGTPPAGGVTFLDARDGSSDFGDDGRVDKSQSANICEACHTYDPAQLVGVKFHGYDMTVGGDAGHYNKADCITCHLHSEGFKPMACDSCHGYPPTTAGAGGPTGLANNPYSTGSTTAGAHSAHAVTLGYACTNCHDGYNMPQESTVKTGFGDISIGFNNFGSTAGTYSGQSNVSYNDALGDGSVTCATVYCHGGTLSGSNPTWTGAVVCGDCHKATNTDMASGALGSHGRHAGDGAGQLNLACTKCHATPGAAGHVGGTVAWSLDTADAKFGASATYRSAASGNTAGRAPSGTYGQCDSVYCHSDGKATPTYQAITWGSTISTCTACHGGAGTTTTLSASHLAHIGTDATDANKQFGFTCDDCHVQTASSNSVISTPANHINLARDVAVSVANGGTGTIGGDFAAGTCATTQCHGSTTPDWTAGAATTGDCSACHGMAANPADARDTNGDTAATDAQVGAHAIHLTPKFSKAVTCDQCHLTTVTNQGAAGTYVGKVNVAGHIDTAGPAELTWGGIADGNDDGQSTPAPVSCATSYCHDASKIKNAWGGADTTGFAWTNPNFIDPDGNDVYVAADCDNCHGYPPAGGHVANTDCSACHDVLNADDLSFTAAGKLTHIDGIVQASGGDSCTDCHGADIDGALNGVHGSHTDTATFLAGKTISGGNYGGAGWYTTTYVGGKPKFGCGECHPAGEGVGHPTAGLNIDLDPAGETPTAGSLKLLNTDSPTNPTFASRSSVTCGNVYCHSDAAASRTYATTPDWYGGAVSGNCTDCHGNAPATGTHDAHAVGIHYQTLYDNDGAGLMASSGTSGSGAAHGDSATSNTISCQICHNDTVTVAYNASNSVCSSCHSDTNTPATGNERAVLSTTGTSHVNGQPDVVFATLASFKAKSQLRDDITVVAELNNSWTRTNGYKAANSFDQAKAAVPGYAAGSCSNIACHNGINTPTWSTGFAGDCRACHTSLPQ